MADQTVNDVSDRGSPQYVAWLLLRGVALKEDKLNSGEFVMADKEWVLRTYSQCLAVTTGIPADAVLKPTR